jgi:hypothetical protein
MIAAMVASCGREFVGTELSAIGKWRKLPIWPVFVICAAILYFCCFYKLRSPFACGQSELIDCSAYWPNHMWLQAFANLGMHGTPGLIALVLARRSLVFLSIWLLSFLVWTMATFNAGLGIDGQNGCENCDFGMFLMVAVSWFSLFPAALVAAISGDQ